MKTEQLPHYTLNYDDSPEAKDRVYEMLLKWFKKQEHFSGEALCQSDVTYEQAPDLLGDLAELGFQFKQIWKE